MILTQHDIDEFAQAYERHRDAPVDDPSKFLCWLSNNPQVVIAAGYQEFVGGNKSPLYKALVELRDLDDVDRPLFRSFEGHWIVPSNFGDNPADPWSCFRLEGLLALRCEEENLWEQIERGEHLAERLPVYDLYDLEKDFERRTAVECYVEMPSVEETISIASHYVDNPLVDQTTLVSSKLWTPYSQTTQKNLLQSSALGLITQLQSQEISLPDVHWKDFEEIVAELLRKRGMEIHVVRENPQGGRDIIGRSESIPGSEVLTIAIEVKHRDVVDRPILQQVVHQNRHFPAIMLVASGRFSAGVITEASKSENRMRLILKDGVAIRDMISAYRL